MWRALEKLAESAANRFGAGWNVVLCAGRDGGVGNLSTSSGGEVGGVGSEMVTTSTGGGLAVEVGGGSWCPSEDAAHRTEIEKSFCFFLCSRGEWESPPISYEKKIKMKM